MAISDSDEIPPHRLLSILFLRLKFVFDHEVFGDVRCFNCLSVVIIPGVALFSAFKVITGLLGLVPLAVILQYSAMQVMITLVYSQILAFTFVRRLHTLNSIADRDDFMISSMTRYTLHITVSTPNSMYSLYPMYFSVECPFWR